jgi:hypothetical protein
MVVTIAVMALTARLNEADSTTCIATQHAVVLASDAR